MQRRQAAAPQLLMPTHRVSVPAAMRCIMAGLVVPTTPPASRLAKPWTVISSRRPRAPERLAMEADRSNPRETSACHLNVNTLTPLLWKVSCVNTWLKVVFIHCFNT